MISISSSLASSRKYLTVYFLSGRFAGVVS